MPLTPIQIWWEAEGGNLQVQKWLAMSNWQKKIGLQLGFNRWAFSCSNVGSLKPGVSLEQRELICLMSMMRAPFSADFGLAKALAFGVVPGGDTWMRSSERSLETRACKEGLWEWG